MFLEWYHFAIVFLLTGIWAEWRYTRGKNYGILIGMEVQKMDDNESKMDNFIKEIRLEPKDLQAQHIAMYLFSAKLKELGLIKFHSDGTMEGYNGNRFKVVDTVESIGAK